MINKFITRGSETLYKWLLSPPKQVVSILFLSSEKLYTVFGSEEKPSITLGEYEKIEEEQLNGEI